MESTGPYLDDARPLAVLTGNLLDVEEGALIGPRVLHVRDARIAAVAGEGDGIGDDEHVLDLSGLAVLPGLIDSHSHLVGEIQTAGIAGTTTGPAKDAMLSVHNARVTLQAGFTTVRDLGTFRAFVDCALRDTIDAGELEGPRMRCAGAFITVPSGGGDVVGLAPDFVLPADLRFGVVTSPAEVRAKARQLLLGGADVLKCIGTGAVLTRGGVPGASELSEDELRAAVEVAAQFDTHVAVHALSDVGAQHAIRAGARSIEHGSMLTEPTIRILADTGTFLSIDIYDGEWALDHGSEAGWPVETMAKLAMTQATAVEAFRLALDRGVRISFGSDSGVYPHHLVARGLDAFVRLGMSALEAIRSATVVAADCIGWADRVGALTPGKHADFVAVDGNPLDDVRVLEAPVVVGKGGRLALDRRPVSPAR